MDSRIWLWTHTAGTHNGQYNLTNSKITPSQASRFMGIDNIIFVVLGNCPAPPFIPHARELADAKQLVWSIVGDASSDRTDGYADLDAVCELARECPNLIGAIMDDFFFEKVRPDGKIARLPLAEVKRCRDVLHGLENPLDLWVVVYDNILDLPIEPYIEVCDVITFWTWQANDLVHLEKNFSRFEAMTSGKRKLLGCYMWDYGNEENSCEIPQELMEKQCYLGWQWLQEGRIEGIIFLGGCLCDLDIAGVRYVQSRKWE